MSLRIIVAHGTLVHEHISKAEQRHRYVKQHQILGTGVCVCRNDGEGLPMHASKHGGQAEPSLECCDIASSRLSWVSVLMS